MEDCSYLVPQHVPDHSVNSYWALGARYSGDKEIGVSWFDFRKKFVDLGGDGIFGAWKVPYLEPVISSGEFRKSMPAIYRDIEFSEGLCPNAEKIQKEMMVFKTNYRESSSLQEQAEILSKTINYFK